jgi:ferredoxin-NADP reductase
MPPPRTLRSSFRSRSYGVLFIGTGVASIWYYNAQSSSEQKKLRYLNPSNFTPFTLVSKDAVSSTSSIFTLSPQNKDPATSRAVKDAFEKGIWSIQFKQPQLQIARNYTPLPDPDKTLADDQLQVLIRREEGGEVSNYLHDLPERSTISIRGPYDECQISADVTEVLFLAGGTGIAPALQLANMLKHRGDMKMNILWASRRREDCVGGQSDATSASTGLASWFASTKSSTERSLPDSLNTMGQIVRLLETLKSQNQPDQLSVQYYIDEERQYIKPTDVSRLLEQPQKGRALILISGPDGFVEYWAGKKQWAMGREAQGVLGGQLANMNKNGWTVVKI